MLHSLTSTAAALAVLGPWSSGEDRIHLDKGFLFHSGCTCSIKDSKERKQQQQEIALPGSEPAALETSGRKNCEQLACQVQREQTSQHLPIAHKEGHGQRSVCVSTGDTGECQRDVLEVQFGWTTRILKPRTFLTTVIKRLNTSSLH